MGYVTPRSFDGLVDAWRRVAYALRVSIPIESRSGLEPWAHAEMPPAPSPKGLQWLGVVGPGVIVLGLSIGSGEFLLGPAAFVKYGLALLWVTGIAVLLQTLFNLEVMRYTVATGEPVFTGFMRTRPSAKAWAVFYTALYFLQSGWPAWAATAAGALYFLFAKRLATPADAAVVYYIGVASFLVCVVVLLFGRRIERTLELLNWILVATVLGSFFVLALFFAAPARAPTFVASCAAMPRPRISVPAGTNVTYNSAGSPIPRIAPAKNTPHWSAFRIRHHPRQRCIASSLGVKRKPVCARFTRFPPTAAAMYPASVPMP